jgi:hypothetical protein
MTDLELHKQLEIINTKVMKGEIDPGQAADRQEAIIATVLSAAIIAEKGQWVDWLKEHIARQGGGSE